MIARRTAKARNPTIVENHAVRHPDVRLWNVTEHVSHRHTVWSNVIVVSDIVHLDVLHVVNSPHVHLELDIHALRVLTNCQQKDICSTTSRKP